MPENSKIFYIIGATMNILGSFLPWRVEGDFLSHQTYGIRIYVDSFKFWMKGLHRFPIQDNGGMLIVIISIFVLLLVLRNQIIRRTQIWVLFGTIILVILNIYHIGDVVLARREYTAIGAPSIQVGLIIISLGSILMLYAGISLQARELKREKR